MEIRELRYFAAVYSERNLTAAARHCFISQPSISTAIASLEAELGTTLFIRHKKGVAPTASAEQFHAFARRIIDEADAARNLFRKPLALPALTLGLMRTLDMPRTVALLKPLTGNSGIALRHRQRRRTVRSALDRTLCRGVAAVASPHLEGPPANLRLC
jgi:LysR family hydrogen peroxide-inducible transcriptional activator